ncbi:MAG TPA: hypothetical protein VJ914_16735 [Pseudonocardiaceae bacterium]|nr:hypothetical protein [Pseudonocardiaceae bacterium]
MTIWLAYVEEHALTDANRRIDGREQRLAGVPDAVLPEPADVLGWLINRRAAYRKTADEQGKAFNELVDDRDGVNSRLTAAGASIYATVRQSATTTIDLCVEAFASDGCASPRGHQFVKNPNGEWRCTKCNRVL